MIDSGGQGKEPLEGVGDVRFDLLRRHAVIEGRHQHHGNIDGRKHVHRHLGHAGDAEHNHDEAKNDNQIGMSDGK